MGFGLLIRSSRRIISGCGIDAFSESSDTIIDPFSLLGESGQLFCLRKGILLCPNNLPILIGISRKSLINKVLGTTPQDAENGTTVLNTIALLNGADLLRVHDVKNAREAIELAGTFCNFAAKLES